MKLYECKYCKRTLNKGALTVHEPTCENIYNNIDTIITDYLHGYSQTMIKNKYKIQTNYLIKLLRDNNVDIRDRSSASKLAHTKFSESYKQSDESKKNLREKRIAWMKANPEKTAWRTRNNPSYPEKLFIQLCTENSLYDAYDIVREYSLGLFYIDFAFVNAKVAIEIDGSQHWLDSDRIDRDIRKEKCIKENGWRLFRIPEFKLKQSYQEITNDLLLFLSASDILEKKYDADIIEFEVIRKARLNAKETKRRLKAKKVDAIVKSRRTDFNEVYPSFGWSSKLGDTWGMSSQAASKYCRKHFDIGIVHVRITKEQIEECLSAKMSLRAIARIYNIHSDTVGDYCRKYGITIPTPVYKVDWDSVDLVLLLESNTISEIARQLDVTPSAVRRRMKKLGLI
jgi:very-short-patch-repair endonuclease